MTEFAYDDNGNMISKTTASGTSKALTTTYQYNSKGLLLNTTILMANLYDLHRVGIVMDCQ